MKKPDILPKLIASRTQSKDDQGAQGVSSEMESDDYHHISEQLSRAAEKINKGKLALDLQDKDRHPSRLSESDEDSGPRQPHIYPYDDGEVMLKTVSSPQNSKGDPKPPSVDRYSTPRQSAVSLVPSQRESPTTNLREELTKIEEKLRKWTGSGTKPDSRHYSYDNVDLSNMKPNERAIIYHPPACTFVRVEGRNIRIIAHMPITMDQCIIFERFPCYSCYDPIMEFITSEDLVWDSFQTIHSETDPTYETPRYMIEDWSVSNSQGKPKVNSFGNSVELTKYLEEPRETETDVEHLLDTKTHLQEQLRDLSSESNEDEENLPKTLGEHQMQYLTDWKSVRDVQINRALSEDRQQAHSPEGQQRSPPPVNYQPEGPIHSDGENDHVRFSQVARLKEYLQSNIQILQEQIDWNSHKTRIEKQLKEQSMSMTPTTKRDKSTSTNGSLGDTPVS